MYWRGEKTRGEISSISKSSLIFRKNSTFLMSFAILRGVIEVTFFEKTSRNGRFHHFLLWSNFASYVYLYYYNFDRSVPNTVMSESGFFCFIWAIYTLKMLCQNAVFDKGQKKLKRTTLLSSTSMYRNSCIHGSDFTAVERHFARIMLHKQKNLLPHLTDTFSDGLTCL